MKKVICKKGLKSSLREIIFGLEDSLVTSLGTVTGVAVATGSFETTVLSGVVVTFVSMVSMAAGSYLSSKSADINTTKSIRAGSIMGISYLLGGFIPIIPYFLGMTLDFPVSFLLIMSSVLLTAITLFGAGVWSGYCTKRSMILSGLEMVVVSLGAALIGSLIGKIVSLIIM